MPTIAVSIATYSGETDHLVNLFNSLEDLKPDEVCIVDTTVSGKDMVFWQWLTYQETLRQFRFELRYYPWDGSYSRIKNAALEMVTSDWVLMLDSDEMLTREAALDMRKMLDGLPKHVLAVRFPRIALLDDQRCCHPWRWPRQRPGAGMHPRIVKAHTGHYVNDMHERYEYPGRNINFFSPDHPKWDWREYYFIHNWLYLDNVLRRRWGKNVVLKNIPRTGIVAQIRVVQNMIIDPRPLHIGFSPVSDVTWRPIKWRVDPSQWAIIWDEKRGQYVYNENRTYKGQAQR